MKKIIIFMSSFCLLAYALSVVFGMNTLIVQENIMGYNVYTIDLVTYTRNIQYSISDLNNTFTSLLDSHYNWDNFINSIKSIGNIFISMLNVTILPFNLSGNMSNVVLSILGIDVEKGNFITNLFATFGNAQIPYITF